MRQQFKRLTQLTRLFVGQLIHQPTNPHEIPRCHKHLDDQYRRTLQSPMVASEQILKLLREDEYFLEMIDFDLNPHYLVQACLVGEELRANIYTLARFECGLMMPAFDPNWATTGITRYHLSHNYGQPEAHPLIRESGFDRSLTYDYFEPVLSYVRDLTQDEIARVNVFSSPNHKDLQ